MKIENVVKSHMDTARLHYSAEDDSDLPLPSTGRGNEGEGWCSRARTARPTRCVVLTPHPGPLPVEGRGRKVARPVVLVMFALLFLQLGCERKSSESSVPPGSKNVSLVPLTNMVAIKAGTFMRIKFPVTITRDFWMGKHEVTQAEYAAVVGRNPSHFTGDSNRPVEKVTFFDASNYCATVTQRERKAGRLPAGYEYRLPSEGEWEYACRAGTTTPFSFGATITPQQVNYNGDPYGSAAKGLNRKKTVVCGSLPANQWGFQEMHGNVLEWCQDGYSETASTTQAAIVGGVGARVLRGGGWSYHAGGCRASSRNNNAPNRQYNAALGCRFARTAD